jgi:bifunctional non-homologous end joining protein LigD
MLRDEPGHLSFVLQGHKLTGRFGLTHTGGRNWILVKANDDAARPGSDITGERPDSVRSGRVWQDLV